MNLWNARRVRYLLKSPQRLKAEADLWSWIERHGGLTHLYDRLQELDLRQGERALLQVLLERPDATAAGQALRLGISQASYFRRLGQLCAAIADQLNQAANQPATIEPKPSLGPAINLPTLLTSFIGRQR